MANKHPLPTSSNRKVRKVRKKGHLSLLSLKKVRQEEKNKKVIKKIKNVQVDLNHKQRDEFFNEVNEVNEVNDILDNGGEFSGIPGNILSTEIFNSMLITLKVRLKKREAALVRAFSEKNSKKRSRLRNLKLKKAAADRYAEVKSQHDIYLYELENIENEEKKNRSKILANNSKLSDDNLTKITKSPKKNPQLETSILDSIKKEEVARLKRKSLEKKGKEVKFIESSLRDIFDVTTYAFTLAAFTDPISAISVGTLITFIIEWAVLFKKYTGREQLDQEQKMRFYFKSAVILALIAATTLSFTLPILAAIPSYISMAVSAILILYEAAFLIKQKLAAPKSPLTETATSKELAHDLEAPALHPSKSYKEPKKKLDMTHILSNSLDVMHGFLGNQKNERVAYPNYYRMKKIIDQAIRVIATVCAVLLSTSLGPVVTPILAVCAAYLILKLAVVVYDYLKKKIEKNEKDEVGSSLLAH